MRSQQDPALQRALASEVKARRSALKLNQDYFAVKVGMNRSFVAKLEIGATSLSVQSLFRLAKALDLDPTDMVASLSRRYSKELKAVARTAQSRPRVAAIRRPKSP